MRSLLIALIAAFIAPAALAATVTVPLDQTRKLNFVGLAANVATGNHEIADVYVINEQTVLVVGKRRGLTNVVIMDRAGRTLLETEIMVAAADASALTINRAGVSATYACAVSCEQVSGAAPAPAAPTAAVAAPAAIISGPSSAPPAPSMATPAPVPAAAR